MIRVAWIVRVVRVNPTIPRIVRVTSTIVRKTIVPITWIAISRMEIVAHVRIIWVTPKG